jgi:hypothetical protein
MRSLLRLRKSFCKILLAHAENPAETPLSSKAGNPKIFAVGKLTAKQIVGPGGGIESCAD